MSPVENFPPEKWEAILAINLSAVFHTTRLAVPRMKQKGWGRIVNTASAHSLVASPNKSAYVAAKHGVAGFTKTVALETATSGITINCISPGYVWTPLVEQQIPDTMKARNLTREQVMNDVLLAAQPTKRFVTPEEVAAMAVFLCRRGSALDHRHEPQHRRRLDGGLSETDADDVPNRTLARLLGLQRRPSANRRDRRTDDGVAARSGRGRSGAAARLACDFREGNRGRATRRPWRRNRP